VLDVPGVGLGHATVVRDEPAPPAGRGSARTGVTTLLLAEDAYLRPLAAGGAVLNGAGECTGFLTAREWGTIETPVYLTSTMQLGRVYDAACEIALEQHDGVADDVVIPVVGECDDSFLNDCRRMQVDAADVRSSYDEAARLARRPLAAARGRRRRRHRDVLPGLQGRHRTASRVTADGHTVAVLLLTNFGERHRLTVAGVPVGRLLPAPGTSAAPPAGRASGWWSRTPRRRAGCARLARRIGLGLARTGSTAHHGSGEIFLAASTTCRSTGTAGPSGAAVAGRGLDPLFEAVVDAAEEAVLNSLLGSVTTTGRDGNTSEGLDPALVSRLLAEAGHAGH
jgi:D-aminopeptidase